MNIASFIHISLAESNVAKKLSAKGNCYFYGDGNDIKEFSVTENTIELSEPIFASKSLKLCFENAKENDSVILLTQEVDIEFSDKFFEVFSNQSRLMNYCDYEIEGIGEYPTIDYQQGSIRDGFRFGPVLFFNKPKQLLSILKDSDYTFGGLYDLVLKINKQERPNHIAENLYKVGKSKVDTRKSGEKQFDYLDTRKRDSQLEFEKIASAYLKEIGASINYKNIKDISFNANQFSVTASVVIPVYNRVRTIEDAVRSALSQKFEKPFNVIVVDNHSSDGTTQVLERIAAEDKRLIHIIPEETDLKIGGCWNKALNAKECGMFAIQLDSDDIYSDENTIKKVVDKFIAEKCAMVIGSYRITNFKLETLPPGLIDHKEWTAENGMNNALRINGLGAPRAFFTPLARQILFPNCSYGEDYAMGLAISRQFKIGRIFDVLYICRRWEGNSDADLTITKQNQNDLAKDAMRTLEIEKRILLNKI